MTRKEQIIEHARETASDNFHRSLRLTRSMKSNVSLEEWLKDQFPSDDDVEDFYLTFDADIPDYLIWSKAWREQLKKELERG